MPKLLLVASCLACVSSGHQSGTSVRAASDRSNVLAKLLLASKSSASFTSAAFSGRSQNQNHQRAEGTKMSGEKLQLKYFDARGVAETARILFKLAGEDYEDMRYEIKPGPPMEVPGFKAAKEAGELKMNLNRAPILTLEDGTVIGQSKSIERFLARRFNLMGKTAAEEGLIDCITEHCRDVKDAEQRKGFGPFTRDKTDEEKAAARTEWFETDLPSFLERIEQVVQETGSPGFAVGSATSLADAAIFSLIGDCSPANKEDTLKAAKKCSALMAISDAIKSQAAVAKWLEERPVTMM